MRADWTASGVCTSGSIVPPRGATRRASGGAATTNTTSAESSRGCRWRNRGTGDLTTHGFRASFPASLLRRLSAALRRQRGDDRPVRVELARLTHDLLFEDIQKTKPKRRAATAAPRRI